MQLLKKSSSRLLESPNQELKKAEAQGLEVRLKAAQGLDSEENVKALMRKQYEAIEDDINKLKAGKFGRLTNVFKMKKKIWW